VRSPVRTAQSRAVGGNGSQEHSGRKPQRGGATQPPAHACPSPRSAACPQPFSSQPADELGPALHDALDFINCHVPPKPCVPEPRTFIGEVRGARPAQRCPWQQHRRPPRPGPKLGATPLPRPDPTPTTSPPQFGYFLRSKNCSALLAPPLIAGAGEYRDTTPEIVASRSMWHLAQAVAWGSPFTLFWQL
jgi:hypothetical protein